MTVRAIYCQQYHNSWRRNLPVPFEWITRTSVTASGDMSGWQGDRDGARDREDDTVYVLLDFV